MKDAGLKETDIDEIVLFGVKTRIPKVQQLLENVISWNSLIVEYTDNGLFCEALAQFSCRQLLGKRPTIGSLARFLTLSSKAESISLGEQLHHQESLLAQH
ncbi:Pentatricopeptide repeat-containing protein family [Quillaja saponaria]|uniref:Pentatricopeptide repeat-containing protein family n=1 Tax=Quillaja saponaria TaxID=32244 RepID=A0AAD7KWL7_QUISA|nr:Pentatricopeptide repeat-containing protein family [Quillaja saponaria]